MSTRFTTINGSDWAAALNASRARRRPAAVRARIFAGPPCPVCKLPGLRSEMPEGVRIMHGQGDTCWLPSLESVAAAGLVGQGTRLGQANPQLQLAGILAEVGT